MISRAQPIVSRLHRWPMMTARASLGKSPSLIARWQEAFSGYVIETDFKPVAKALAAYCGEHAIEPGALHYQIVGDALLSARMHALKGRANALEGKPSDEPTTFLLNRPIDPNNFATAAKRWPRWTDLRGCSRAVHR